MYDWSLVWQCAIDSPSVMAINPPLRASPKVGVENRHPRGLLGGP